MASTLPNSGVNRLDQIDLRMAKVEAKKVGSWDQQIGQAIEYAISMTNRTQTEVWRALGHNDGSELSKWCAGTRTADFAKLFSIVWLRKSLLVSLAGLVEEIQVETTLRMRL